MKVLITGISGKLGRLVAHECLSLGFEVLGLDRRTWEDAPEGVVISCEDIRKRPAEDIFRKHRPDAVIHMATVSHTSASPEERYRINLNGTRSVFDHANHYDVKQVIFVGRHTYYGAAPDSPLYHSEDEPPLAVSTFPELSDMVAADLYACNTIWRLPKLTTCILRMCYTLGPSHHGTLASYLSGPRVPTVLGFDPLYQFMHEVDSARAIVAALLAKLEGVYNVSGPSPVPLGVLIKQCGRSNLPLPEPLFTEFLGRFGLPNLPRGSVNHIKFPVVIDSSMFRRDAGFEARFDEAQTMQSFKFFKHPKAPRMFGR